MNYEKIQDVYATKQYDAFKMIDGNRLVNPAHVSRLMRSMSENQLITPIVVNNKYQIIDGQHRYYSIKKLELPLYFIICENYGLNEVHRLNESSNDWKLDDFLHGYAVSMEKENYILLKQFIEENDISVSLALSLTKKDGESIQFTKSLFRNGEYVPYLINEAQEFLNALQVFRPYFDDYKSINFIKAFKLLYSSPKYENKNMIRKLTYQAGYLQNKSTVGQYINLLTDIYNSKMQMDKKIFFDATTEII